MPGFAGLLTLSKMQRDVVRVSQENMVSVPCGTLMYESKMCRFWQAKYAYNRFLSNWNKLSCLCKNNVAKGSKSFHKKIKSFAQLYYKSKIWIENCQNFHWKK